MNRKHHIFIGIGIFLMFGLFSFTFGSDGLQWTWFDMTSGILGLLFLTIILIIWIRYSKTKKMDIDDGLELRELHHHDVEGYNDEEFV